MIKADIQKLEPGSLIRLFELDATMLGGDVQRFHGHLQEGTIIWQGQPYHPISIDASGVEWAANKTVAPRLVLGNEIDGQRGAISALCLYFNDFVGAKVTIRETFRHYLDAVNFPQGNPGASDEEFISTWYIEQKTGENLQSVTFELTSPADLQGQLIPTRQITSRCAWAARGEYRGEACRYVGPYFDIDGQPTDDPARDKCNGLLSTGCTVRHGRDQQLPFGGFAASSLIR